MEKRKILVFVIALFLLPLVSASLGLSPAVVEFNFVPGYERTLTYHVSSGNPNQLLGIYVKGDLEDYIKISDEEIVGSGEFEIELSLPLELDRPGVHRTLIGVKQIFTEEEKELGGMIGVQTRVQGVLNVFVPYPGKYLELELKTENVNTGEPVEFLLNIDNKGKEDVKMEPRVEIYSGNEKLETIGFFERELISEKSIKLRRELDTTDYLPGDYEAAAIVEYGEKVAEDRGIFKLGELYVKIINNTKMIEIEKIQKFDVMIESRWNRKIENIYANLSFFNETHMVTSLRTSPVSLQPWQESKLTGYVDSSDFEEGNYDVNITLYYEGQSSGEKVQVEFFKENESNLILISLIIGGIAVILIILFLSLKKFKNGKK